MDLNTGLVPRRAYINVMIGLLGPILVPIIHLGIEAQIWRPVRAKHLADPKSCTCTCWDTLFKGPYEKSNHPGYKNIYFNLNYSTAFIWAITVVSSIAFYELLKYLLTLHRSEKMCYKMFILLSFSIYPHYYSWWGYFNAFNDLFYDQLLHQFIFSSTELISTFAIVLLCDKDEKNTKNKLLTIYFVAMFHIMCAGLDQFLSNVIFGQGKTHQQTRDLMFMLSDVMNLSYSLKILYNAKHSGNSTIGKNMIYLFSLACISTLIVKRL